MANVYEGPTLFDAAAGFLGAPMRHGRWEKAVLRCSNGNWRWFVFNIHTNEFKHGLEGGPLKAMQAADDWQLRLEAR